ncbi:hypothetical protein ANN_25807 [Periplaneta americana]|uniref:HAT C-terminal dimerisation domain-containing protein n=1 Tax=Periplaneta americana TaxID=6978 RepID=A0ABQ8S472_PERAM|nr:hypothetical protein ANN_25807 [Periplaneta americana]
MIQDDQVAIPKCNNISITILSPKYACGNVTDEDSGDENNPTIDSMPGSQLRSETEVTLNTQGEGMDDYDDESHNGDDEHSKGDGAMKLFSCTHKALKRFYTLPVTTATPERSFSTLRYLKTYLRSTMGADRLNGLALMYTFKNVEVKAHEVLDQMSKKPRRLLLHMSFCHSFCIAVILSWLTRVVIKSYKPSFAFAGSSLLESQKTAEPNKIPIKFLQDSDKLIRSALKQILQLPTDTPDNMIYSDMKCKGLGLFKAEWEAHLQHANTCRVLALSANPYVTATRDLFTESTECVKSLQLTELSDELEAWAKLPQKGLGVELYSEFTPANSWIRHREGLTSSEWREAIKMTAHVSSVRSLPGRTRDNILCRRCHREPETLAHVLGSCPHGEVLRNSRHHRIRSMIAEQFRSINFQVFEEVHGLADNGSTRRIDMIAIPPNNNNGYIIDPTVRFEKQKSQPEDVKM